MMRFERAWTPRRGACGIGEFHRLAHFPEAEGRRTKPRDAGLLCQTRNLARVLQGGGERFIDE